MIISTTKSDTMLKRSVGKGKTSIIAIDKMIDQFTLDPKVTNPVRDAYVVTNEDVSSTRLKQKFEQALLTKHPDVKIIFINKGSKPIYPNGLQGLDAILQKPKPDDITQAITAVMESNTIADAAIPEAQQSMDIPEFNPQSLENKRRARHAMNETYNLKDDEVLDDPNKNNQTVGATFDFTNIGGTAPGMNGEGIQIGEGGAFTMDGNGVAMQANFNTIIPQPTIVATYEDGSFLADNGVVYDKDGNPIPEKEPFFEGIDAGAPEVAEQVVEEFDYGSALADRIKQSQTVADISQLTKNLQASTLIKDMIETNSTYAGIEEKLKSLNDTIFNILGDNSIKSLDVKLSKIHAILHDKAFFSAKGDTLIEQRLEEVIDTICTRTSSLLQSRLEEIDTAIRRVSAHKDSETNSARLTGLNEERANIIIELRTLEMEINQIFKSVDSLIISTATQIAENSDNITGNDMINMHLKARGTIVVSDETVTAVRAALELASDKVPDQFNVMKIKVVSMIKLLSKMFDLDQEIIAAQQAEINFLRAHNVEDSIIAETILKKALRVYIGEGDTGRTIIPYLISKYKSRQNANVLCIDLTGEAKYTSYGILYQHIDTYLTELNQKEFLLVAGRVDNTIEAAQRIVTALIKSADYYRVINVVLDPEQRELFETIAQDVLSVNFIVDTNVQKVERMREIISRCTMPNVGRRVIVNQCDVPIRPIITKLGLDNQIDFQVCVVPNIPVVVDAGLNGYDPYGISSVDLVMEDVVKHA